MTQDNPQVQWTPEQWARVNQVIQEEASRARVAATFLPLFGPLPPDSDFVRADRLSYTEQPGGRQRMKVDDTHTIQLATLQVKVYLRGAQMADPAMTSALQMFRRAANVLARLEDVIVFNGQTGEGAVSKEATAGLPMIWEVTGGQACAGLLPAKKDSIPVNGEDLVAKVSQAIGQLESDGHFGPFTLVLGNKLFTDVQTPNKDSLVLPQDRIIPFLGGGSLLRSSTIAADSGLLVAMGGAPVELVVASDLSCSFLQLTTDPSYVFRVYEKIVLRIKEPNAVVGFHSA